VIRKQLEKHAGKRSKQVLTAAIEPDEMLRTTILAKLGAAEEIMVQQTSLSKQSSKTTMYTYQAKGIN